MSTESEEIEQLKRQLKQARLLLEQQNQLLEKQFRKLEEQKQTLRAKTEAIAQKDKTIAQKDEAIAQKDKAIAQKDKAIAQKDEALEVKETALKNLSALAGAVVVLCRDAIDAKIQAGSDPITDQDRLKWIYQHAQEDLRELTSDRGYIRLLKYITSTGTEKLSRKASAAEEAEEQTKNLRDSCLAVRQTNVSVAANEQKFENLADAVGRVAQELSNSGVKSELVEVAASMAAVKTPAAAEPIGDAAMDLLQTVSAVMQTEADKAQKEAEQQVKARRAAGRQVPQAKQSRKNLFECTFQTEGICPHCGGTHALQQVTFNEYFLRTLRALTEDLLTETTIKCPVVKCTDCGTVFTDRPKEAPVPYSPAAGAQVDSQTVIQLAIMSAMGITANKSLGLLDTNQLDKLASQGFERPVHGWLQSTGIGGILAEAHKKAAQKLGGAIVMDETPFPILEPKGQGAKPDPKSACKSPYIGCITSATYGPVQFAVFERMPSRSGESIAGVLSDWHDIDTLSTDGYAGYDNALKRLNRTDSVAQHNCTVHWRRTLFEAAGIAEAEAKLGTPEGDEEIRRKLLNASVDTAFITAIGILGQIYAHERSISRKAGESEAKFLERIKEMRQREEKPLMDQIGRLMESIAPRFAKRGKNGRWQAANESLYAKGVVYWLNHEEKIRYFLEEPRLSPDTNIVERCVRAAAVARRCSFFKQTNEYMDSQCNGWTLYETAKLNGIASAAKWLISFHRAFYEHCERYVYTARYQRLRLEKGDQLALRIQKITQDVIDAFDFTPWLAWNYAKALPENEKSKPL